MSLIIWKDGTIVADRCLTTGNLGRPAKKLRRVGNAVLAFTGPSDFGLALIAWAEGGYRREAFPPTQQHAEYATLVRAEPLALSSRVELYYQTPEPVVQESFGANGVGAEFAMGAMCQGATAEEAMRLAQSRIPALAAHFGYDVEYFR